MAQKDLRTRIRRAVKATEEKSTVKNPIAMLLFGYGLLFFALVMLYYGTTPEGGLFSVILAILFALPGYLVVKRKVRIFAGMTPRRMEELGFETVPRGHESVDSVGVEAEIRDVLERSVKTRPALTLGVLFGVLGAGVLGIIFGVLLTVGGNAIPDGVIFLICGCGVAWYGYLFACQTTATLIREAPSKVTA